MTLFTLSTQFSPCGDQPQAIAQLTDGINSGKKSQVLLGVTGSGKTFTMANVIANVNMPTLVIAPNKTLAAQLYAEFKSLFPDNAVEYFVSYYDYYQPEAYLPAQDAYIEKDSSINDRIDRLRHSATHALLTRKDVIIVASVSCIYGLGSPEAYHGMLLSVQKGLTMDRQSLLARLIDIQYKRNDVDFQRGTFRVRGEHVDIIPVYEDAKAVRLEFFGDEISDIFEIDSLTGCVLGVLEECLIFPGSHFVMPKEQLKSSIGHIRDELNARIDYFHINDQPLERARIEQRTRFDLEMIEEMGVCKGIENYSRYLTGRPSGMAPPTLLEYFPNDFLMMIDESHITVSQVGGMYHGDRSRKQTLVDYGFRLPSALDNRPLQFDEFEKKIHQVIYVSATPADYELTATHGEVVEQVIRPTGLMDPCTEVRSTTGQVDDLYLEIQRAVAQNERVLITTLTKRMSEQLAEFFDAKGVRARYLHSDIDSLERIEILHALRLGTFDVLIGINLLREGLDLPEVGLVAILDADREGFLRSTRSLIQTFGRAARHINGRVILYADKITTAMAHAIDETSRRRQLQEQYNDDHGITPESIQKEITNPMNTLFESDYVSVNIPEKSLSPAQLKKTVSSLRKQMIRAANELKFEDAAEIRDRIYELESVDLGLTP